ncbi:MAG: 7-cyano-7-deazaguanine synthase [Planctomycetota bacterium]|nr:7-cyano-7-deazaguanine synthase [Planctomycetota bacterium]RLS24618.1 MAG: 7-cyano-7-deazaguanine synthase [Planctomycetota bacterium]
MIKPQNSLQLVAVLMSGGSDSGILAVDLARQGFGVQPVYIKFGLRWEDVELEHARQFLAAVNLPLIKPLVTLDQPMSDVYGDHWSRMGEVPDANSEDQAVYLPGRNCMLISKAAVWCALNGIHVIHTGVLAGNPFADATSEFFELLANGVSVGLDWPILIQRPYSKLDKKQVLEIGRDLPLEFTFSCLNPVKGHHCGDCNKCAERRKAFLSMGICDKTVYDKPFSETTA